jgi:uncharacterized membrane protein
MARKKGKVKKAPSLEKHIAQVTKRLEKLRSAMEVSRVKETAMVQELADLMAQLPVVVAKAVEPTV